MGCERWRSLARRMRPADETDLEMGELDSEAEVDSR